MLGNSNLLGSLNAVGRTSPNFDEEPATSNVSGGSTFAVSTAATNSVSEIIAEVAGSQLLGETSSIPMTSSMKASAFEATPNSDVKPAISNVCNESAFGVSTVATKNLSEATTEVTGSGLLENTSSISGTPASTNTSALEATLNFDAKPATSNACSGLAFGASTVAAKSLSEATTEVTSLGSLGQMPSITPIITTPASTFGATLNLETKPATNNVCHESAFGVTTVAAKSLSYNKTVVTSPESLGQIPSIASIIRISASTLEDEKPATTNVCGGSTFEFSSADTKCLSRPTTGSPVTGSELIKQAPSFTSATPAPANTSSFGDLDAKPATTNVSGGSTFEFSSADTKCLSKPPTQVTNSELIKQTPSFTFTTPAPANTPSFGDLDAKPATTNVSGGSTFEFSSADTKCLSKPTTQVTNSELIKQTPSFTFTTPAPANTPSFGDEKPATTNVSGGSTLKFSFADTKCLSKPTTQVTGSEVMKQTPTFTFGTPAPANMPSFGDEKPATTNVSGGSTFKFSFADTKCLSKPTTQVTGSELMKQTPPFTFATPVPANTPSFGAFGATKGATRNVWGDSTSGVFSHNTGSLFNSATQFNFSQPSHVQMCSHKSPIQAFGSGLFGQTSFGTPAPSGSFTFGAESGTTIKFKPATDYDTMKKGGICTIIFTRLQCITVMKEYKHKSLEELRMEDYAANRNGRKAIAAPVFGSTTGGPFATFLKKENIFGTNTASSLGTSGITRGTIQQTGYRFSTTPAASTFGFGFGSSTQCINPFNTSGTTTENDTGDMNLRRFYRKSVNRNIFNKNDLKTLKESVSFAEASVQTQSEFCTERLSVDLSELLLTGDCSDFTIEVKGVEFHLHRGILSARSPVFQSMFKHNMIEKETGRVSVDDCEVDTFRAFVRYVYTGRTDQLNTDIVFGLFALADKYQVDELKSACIAFIKSNLSVETFCDTVQFALRYDNRELLEQTVDFLAVKTSEVMKTVKWMNFLAANHIQANELLLKALDRKQH